MIKPILFSIASLFIGSISIAADKPIKKTVPQIVAKIWQPITLNEDIDRLPPNYEGNESIKFFNLFKSKIRNLKKDDYETSEEFSRRTKDVDSLLSPISMNGLYPFFIPNIYAKYYADSQAYILEGGFNCIESISDNWFTCKIGEFNKTQDTYIGSNALGVSREITRIRGHDLALALRHNSSILGTALESNGNRGRYVFRDRVPVLLERAKELRDKKISVLFLGKIIDTKIILGKPLIEHPKIDFPNDIFITEDAIPFEVKKIFYFIFETGEILWQRTY